MFRGLRPDEIEVRVGTVGKKGVTMLLYKDARCDMNILDETYGCEGWQRDHKEIKGNLYAGVAVWNETLNQWIWKWDCGTESNTEKEKGEASDSFKRACFNLGIGRELYTAGLIFIECETIPDDEKAKFPKFNLKDKFAFNGIKVTDVQYKEENDKRFIGSITICDKRGNMIFGSGPKKAQKAETQKPQIDTPDAAQAEIEKIKAGLINKVQITSIENELKRTGIKTLQITINGKKYAVDDLSKLNFEQWKESMEMLSTVPDKKETDLPL